MAVTCEIFMNCSKNLIGTCKNIDVKEQMGLTNVKYFRLSTKYFMGISILCVYTHVCTI